MSTAKKPKLKFNPRRMYANPLLDYFGKSKLDIGFTAQAHKQAVPVLVLPADPESVQALMDRLAEAFSGSYDGHLAGDDLRAMMRALGFKTKGKKL